MEAQKLNIGCGRIHKEGYVNIDITQIIDGRGKACVDLILDIEHEKMPFEDSSVTEILADNMLEHIEELRFFLNECHRVLNPDGLLVGCVPVAGSKPDFKDPTHKRHFIMETFDYFTGEAGYDSSKPSHPKYADYGFLPWYKVELEQREDMIYFKLKPRKI